MIPNCFPTSLLELVAMNLKHVLFSAFAASVQQVTVFAQTTVPIKVVDLGYATYQTDVSLDEGVTSFLGIRYAAAPLGACPAASHKGAVGNNNIVFDL
jgi:hypothetical protein